MCIEIFHSPIITSRSSYNHILGNYSNLGDCGFVEVELDTIFFCICSYIIFRIFPMSIYSSWSSCGTYSGIIHNVCLIILSLRIIALITLWSLADLIHSDKVRGMQKRNRAPLRSHFKRRTHFTSLLSLLLPTAEPPPAEFKHRHLAEVHPTDLTPPPSPPLPP